MTTVDERPASRRLVIYLVVGIVFGALLVVGLLLFRSGRSDAEAEAKAGQFITRLTQEGVTRAPTQDQLVRLLGTDGGAICADPNSALAHAMSDSGIANGAGGPGTRPVLAADRVVRGEALVVEVYCPEKLPAFQQYVNGLAFAHVAGG